MTQSINNTNLRPEQDAIFLEVFWTRMRSIVNEAAKLIVRTSFSTLSTEANDFAVVVTDSAGRAVAENSGSIPSFIATLPSTVRTAIERFGSENMRPGDVFITNNPWIGTGHLNDISLVKPIFHRNQLIGFAATAAHVPDIGGRIRSVDARELYEEGLHIPLMRFLAAGQVDETLLLMITTNVRTPEQTVGDIWTQVGAVELIDNRLVDLLSEYQLPGIDALAQAVFTRSEAAMRQAIQALPDGEYSYQMQTDGFDTPYDYAVTVRISGSEISCDFAGTSPQQPRGINCVLAYTRAMTVYAIKCLLLPELPNNDGLFRPITTLAPEGTLLNPRMPAAVGGRACTGHYVPILIFGALYAVLPNKIMAGVGSPLWIANLAGTRSDGKSFATVLFFNGGMGATSIKDGSSVMSWPSNISCTPIEIAERDAPLFFKTKALRPNSGGAGTYRGGLGEEITFVSTHDRSFTIMFLTERLKFAAPGFGGGEDGALGQVLINGKIINSRLPQLIEPGDEICMRTPGGAGFGPPSARVPQQLQQDQRQGYVA